MKRIKWVRGLVAVALAALVVTATAAAAGSAGGTKKVTLRLVGTHATAAAKCGDAKANLYSSVGRGVALALGGSVLPTPSNPGFHVHVTVKRCINQHYTKVWTGTAVGRANGTFRITYVPKSAGLFIAVADYGKNPNVSSRKIRVRVG